VKTHYSAAKIRKKSEITKLSVGKCVWLTVNEILDVIKETSINNKYTTDPDKIPSGSTVQSGYGKIDCLAGLKKILGATAIEHIIADERLVVTSYSS
jgi:hypothetical protein